jgi:hypothetical protein
MRSEFIYGGQLPMERQTVISEVTILYAFYTEKILFNW